MCASQSAYVHFIFCCVHIATPSTLSLQLLLIKCFTVRLKLVLYLFSFYDENSASDFTLFFRFQRVLGNWI